ncbi:MAG: hypothetical protein MHM6MM_001443 [Cercozoa sp. M6MM]
MTENVEIYRVSDRGEVDVDAEIAERCRREGITMNKASNKSTVTNIVNNVLGSGLLVLPWAFARASALPGVFLTLLTGSLAVAALYFISCASEERKIFTFHGLWQRAFPRNVTEDSQKPLIQHESSRSDVENDAEGAFSSVATDELRPSSNVFVQAITSSRVVNVALFFCTYSAVVSYGVLIGDFLTPVLREWLLPSESAFVRLVSNRDFFVPLIVLTFCLPLALLRDLHALRHASLLGVLSISYSALLVLVTAIQNGVHPSVDVFRLDGGLFVAISIMNVAYTMHYNAPRFYAELKNKSPAKFGSVSMQAMAACFLVYASAALAGYLQFGNDVCGEVLSSLPNNSFSTVARLLMAACLVCTFPLPFSAARHNFDGLFFPKAVWTRKRHVIQTVSLVVSAVFFAVVFPQVEKILGFQGAIVGSLVVYVFPSLIYLRLVTQRPKLLTYLAYGMLVFGTVTGILGTVVTAMVSPTACD